MVKYLALALALSVMGFVSAVEVDVGVRAGNHRDGYAFRGGKVMFYKGGTPTAITQEVILANGVRVLPDGYIVYKDGRRERFVEDHWVTTEGEYIVATDEPVDFDGYFWRDNRIYVMRGGHETLVTTEVVLTDGSRLQPDGFIIARDGTRNRFSADMRISLDGKMVNNKDNKNGYRSPNNEAASKSTSRNLDNINDPKNANTNRNDPNANRTEPNRNDPNAHRTEPNRTEPNANRTEPNRTEPNANRTEPNRTEPNANRTEPNRTEPNANRTEPNRTEPNANRAEPNRAQPNDRTAPNQGR